MSLLNQLKAVIDLKLIVSDVEKVGGGNFYITLTGDFQSFIQSKLVYNISDVIFLTSDTSKFILKQASNFKNFIELKQQLDQDLPINAAPKTKKLKL